MALEPELASLAQYDWRIANYYPNPAHITDAPKGTWAYQYHTASPAMRTTAMVSYSAPDYGWKANMLYPAKNIKQGNLGSGTGAAPTQGVYTGMANGCSGGNPYS